MAHGEVVGTNTVVADMVGNTNTFSVTVFVGSSGGGRYHGSDAAHGVVGVRNTTRGRLAW